MFEAIKENIVLIGGAVGVLVAVVWSVVSVWGIYNASHGDERRAERG